MRGMLGVGDFDGRVTGTHHAGKFGPDLAALFKTVLCTCPHHIMTVSLILILPDPRRFTLSPSAFETLWWPNSVLPQACGALGAAC